MPTGYLTEPDIRGALRHISRNYPLLTQLMEMPEPSIEGRPVFAIRIGGPGGPRVPKPGLLLIGGVHARELVPPDLLLSFAIKLCQTSQRNQALTLGGKTYSSADVRRVIMGLDLFIMPMVNPDGRVLVQTPPPAGDAWWRKNRRQSSCSVECWGVDINRNYDFLFLSGLGTSTNPCDYQVYKGCGPFSEPETRNVRHLLEANTNIVRFVDIHSAAALVLTPWGDDQTQTTDPTMNFMNPQYDGLRGPKDDTLYKEYIPPADNDQFVSIAATVSAAIATFRQNKYTPGSIRDLLYATSGTSLEYAYSRHFVDPQKRKILGFSIELGGGGFQPDYSEALNVIAEASAGLMEFCLEAAGAGLDLKLSKSKLARSKPAKKRPPKRKSMKR